MKIPKFKPTAKAVIEYTNLSGSAEDDYWIAMGAMHTALENKFERELFERMGNVEPVAYMRSMGERDALEDPTEIVIGINLVESEDSYIDIHASIADIIDDYIDNNVSPVSNKIDGESAREACILRDTLQALIDKLDDHIE